MALGGTGFRLEIRPLATLLPHERTIPSHVSRIEEELKRDGVQKDPVIVDSESGTVLDGMHRLAALLKLGHENVVCGLVDYSSDGVVLRRWARWYPKAARGDLSRVGGSLGLGRSLTTESAIAMLASREVGLALFSGKSALTFDGPSTLLEAFRAVDQVDRLAEEGGWERRFVPEDEVRRTIDEGGMVALARELDKKDVVSAARSRVLFPCKTSMHVIDPRPVGVRFPLSELDSPAGRETLGETLRKSRVTLPPGSVYEGRRYKERLLLLNPR